MAYTLTAPRYEPCYFIVSSKGMYMYVYMHIGSSIHYISKPALFFFPPEQRVISLL